MFFQRVGIQRALKGLHGEADRQRLQAELTACKTEAPAQARLCLRAQLRGFLDDWPGFLSGNVAEARPVLHLVLADRIGFTPMADRGYQLDSTRGAGKAETGQNLAGRRDFAHGRRSRGKQLSGGVHQAPERDVQRWWRPQVLRVGTRSWRGCEKWPNCGNLGQSQHSGFRAGVEPGSTMAAIEIQVGLEPGRGAHYLETVVDL